ncbi:MAG: YbhB/YbcL family Raf kinase inhibitor-like protein [Microthrixaceae bacterium]
MRPRPRSRSRFVLFVVTAVAAVAVAAAGCSSADGRSLPAPQPHQTTTSAAAPDVGQPSDVVSGGVFSLRSPSYLEGGLIPERHTCRGIDVSPALVWTDTPPAAELALVMRDRDANGFVHWVMTAIDPVVQGIGEGGIPEGALALANSTGAAGWFGPCPPAGSGAHTYELVLHALPEPLVIDPAIPAEQAAQMVEGASSDRAVLSGVVQAAE